MSMSLDTGEVHALVAAGMVRRRRNEFDALREDVTEIKAFIAGLKAEAIMVKFRGKPGYQERLATKAADILARFADCGCEEAEVFAITAEADLPLADREMEWDGSAAEMTLRERASSDGTGDPDTIDWTRYGEGFFWRDDEADPETFGAYGLPFAQVIDSVLYAIPRGIFAVAGVLQGAQGGTDIPQEDQDRIRESVGVYYDKMRSDFEDPEIKAPWEE